MERGYWWFENAHHERFIQTAFNFLAIHPVTGGVFFSNLLERPSLILDRVREVKFYLKTAIKKKRNTEWVEKKKVW